MDSYGSYGSVGREHVDNGNSSGVFWGNSGRGGV